jgi:hypothetical protein
LAVGRLVSTMHTTDLEPQMSGHTDPEPQWLAILIRSHKRLAKMSVVCIVDTSRPTANDLWLWAGLANDLWLHASMARHLRLGGSMARHLRLEIRGVHRRHESHHRQRFVALGQYGQTFAARDPWCASSTRVAPQPTICGSVSVWPDMCGSVAVWPDICGSVAVCQTFAALWQYARHLRLGGSMARHFWLPGSMIVD